MGNNIIERGRYIPGMMAHFPLRSSQPTNNILVKTKLNETEGNNSH